MSVSVPRRLEFVSRLSSGSRSSAVSALATVYRLGASVADCPGRWRGGAAWSRGLLPAAGVWRVDARCSGDSRRVSAVPVPALWCRSQVPAVRSTEPGRLPPLGGYVIRVSLAPV